MYYLAMGKIRTYDNLESIINNNSQKRKREIVSLKNICNSLAKNKNTYEQSVLLKSLVVISYSHFEGFVKDATKSYFEFINTVSLKSNNVNLKLLSSYIQYLYLSNTLSKVDLIETIQNLLERSIPIRFEQPLNAFLPISVAFSTPLTTYNEEQPSNAFLPMLTIPVKVTFSKVVTLLNAYSGRVEPAA